MGRFGDFLQPSALPYPGAPTTGQEGSTCGNAPYSPPERDGFFNKLFAPKDLAYPLPVCVRPSVVALPQKGEQPATPIGGASQPAPTPSVVTTAASGAPLAPPSVLAAPGSVPAASIAAAPLAPALAPPVTVVLVPFGAMNGVAGGASWPVALATAPAPSNGAAPVSAPASTSEAASSGLGSTGGTATTAPTSTNGAVSGNGSTGAVSVALPSIAPTVPGCSALLPGEPYLGTPGVSKMRRAYTFNPEFAPSFPSAQEAYLEDVLGDVISTRMVTKDSTPVAFVVPDGCDSMDLLFGPVEVNPGCGCDSDLDQIVTVGDAKLSANVGDLDAPLTPGDQVIVAVPWRAASWASLPAGRLRMTVYARFYQAMAK